jgi:uncharacterized repeat protein (TIGR03803 family)
MTPQTFSRALRRTLSVLALFVVSALVASAATETIVHSFNRQPNGANPEAGLIADAAGNLYGTAVRGGSYGVVFKLSFNSHHTWTETVIHNFTGGYGGPDGVVPEGDLLFDATGNLYGVTEGGGTNNCGIAYKLSPVASGPWKETILHNFTCYPSDGAHPSGGLIFDAAGNLYGVANVGGSGGCGDGYSVYGCGAVYELSPTSSGAYTEAILYSFTSNNNFEGNPSGRLVFDKSGNLYGTAQSGGTGVNCYYYGCGTAFKLTPGSTGWTETTIYNLTGLSDGDTPSSGVIFDASGNLWGTGAGYYNYGGIFELTPNSDGTWTETSPYTFGATVSFPYGNIVIDAAGNLFGAAEATPGCSFTTGCGAIYELSHGSSGWTETTLYTFTGKSDGSNPMSTLLRDAGGNLYATTEAGGVTLGGVGGAGSVFKLSPASGGKWTGAALYDFPMLDEGTIPYGGLVADSAGNLYGTTETGGLNIDCGYYIGCGTVFQLSPITGGWKETIIYNFTGTNGDGAYPMANLAVDASGNLYGTTRYGGVLNSACTSFGNSTNCGTVFKLAPNGNGTWTESVLHSFTGYASGDGANPTTGLVLDASGNVYGTTSTGGSTFNAGIAFQLTPSSGGTWTENILHVFGAPGDIGAPSSTLVFDKSGSLYGSAGSGNGTGFFNGGVFRLSPSGGGWTESLLFTFATGNAPTGVALDSEGNLYGTTVYGGSYNGGLAYKLTSNSSLPWTQTILYNFIGVNGDGAVPQGSVILDAAGNLYGTTTYGGLVNPSCITYGCGTVFELSPTTSGPWRERVVHRFTGGKDGSAPYGGVILDSAGNVFGTATAGGSGASGIVFEVKP